MALRILVVGADPARVGELGNEISRLGGEVSQIPPDEFEDQEWELRAPHAVILDGRDPRVIVARLAGMIRGSRRLRSTVVMAIVPDHHLTSFSLRDEVDDFVVAPLREAELRARLTRLFARIHEAPSATAVVAGELTIDPATYDVTLSGARVDLTLKEYELLKYLVTNPGRVFTRDQLLDSVWGYDYVGGTRTVDVHIRRLRAKLGELGETAIDTVRGVGYSFRPPRQGE